VRQDTRFVVIEARDQRLTDGFHDYESAVILRWTSGDPSIPPEVLAGFVGPMEVVLALSGSTLYLDGGAGAERWAAQRRSPANAVRDFKVSPRNQATSFCVTRNSRRRCAPDVAGSYFGSCPGARQVGMQATGAS
jgi:hypothetical protein